MKKANGAMNIKEAEILENTPPGRLFYAGRQVQILPGELLRSMQKNEGTKGQLQGSNDGGTSGGHKMLPPEQYTPTLAELGVNG